MLQGLASAQLQPAWSALGAARPVDAQSLLRCGLKAVFPEVRSCCRWWQITISLSSLMHCLIHVRQDSLRTRGVSIAKKQVCGVTNSLSKVRSWLDVGPVARVGLLTFAARTGLARHTDTRRAGNGPSRPDRI